MSRLLLCVSFFLCSLVGIAQVQLSKIFGDSMVLQRDRPIPIWGTAPKNQKITVQFHQQTKTVKTNTDGKWQVQLDPETAGGPYQLVVSGNTTTTLRGILTGDVWICSGQSNMNFRLIAARNSRQEIQQANFPAIRHFQVAKDVAGKPKNDLEYKGSWKAATPANAGDFTAVGYFFARELNQQLQIPIGLIHTSWGGTEVETWISRDNMNKSEVFSPLLSGLPVLDTDSLVRARQKDLLALLNKLQGGLPAPVKVKEWKEYLFDDHSWPQMQLPGVWEQQQLKNIDGIVWFRKTITIDAADAGKAAVLKLGQIDDIDETYVNGTKIGSTADPVAKRVYTIPAGILHAGKNVIAVRVNDTGGGGGIYGDAIDLAFTTGNLTQSLAGPWAFQVETLAANPASLSPNGYPSLLYNAMIHPLLPFAIKGAIWYQGESNAGRAYQYRQAFPLLINDWRQQWKQGDFPFYFVQLASYKAGGGTSAKGSSWAELREAQTLTLSLPNTGMAITTDVGETADIHPKNKQDVGKRLAVVALHDTYGKKNVYTGPVYQSMKADGNKLVLSFTQAGSGLTTKDAAATVIGFEVAGADQQFYPAQAVIDNGKVVVSANEVSQPVAVRYSWADDAGQSNLYNKEGFPAGPFRTDQWKASTAAQQYKIIL
jgi:sialate O-acetylesterase